MNRVSPPSTGITYTRSADCSPVCGLAYTMLSIFTASTGPSDLTGSPVNGSSSGPVGVGCGVGLGRGATVAAATDRAGGGAPPDVRARVTDSAVIAATPAPAAAVSSRCRDTHCRSLPAAPRGPLIGPPSVVPVSGLPSPRNGKRKSTQIRCFAETRHPPVSPLR